VPHPLQWLRTIKISTKLAWIIHLRYLSQNWVTPWDRFHLEKPAVSKMPPTPFSLSHRTQVLMTVFTASYIKILISISVRNWRCKLSKCMISSTEILYHGELVESVLTFQESFFMCMDKNDTSHVTKYVLYNLQVVLMEVNMCFRTLT